MKVGRFVTTGLALLCAGLFAAQAVAQGAGGVLSDGLSAEEAQAARKRAVTWIELARLRAGEGAHEAALVAADSALAVSPGDAEARLLRARLLSWLGRFGAADSAFASLAASAPGDADIATAQAASFYYQGRLEEAARVYGAVLAADSSHAEAREGLARVAKARESRATASAVSARRWRVDAGGEYSTFSRRTVPAWNQQFVQVARRIDAADGLSGPMAVHGRVERFERYDLTDWALEAGVYREFFPRLRGMFAGGWSPDAVFRPQWRLAADAEYLLRASAARGGALPAVWGLAGARYDVYQAAEFLGLLPGARLEWGPWAVTGQMSHVSEVGADALTGWSLRFDGLTGSPRLGPLREGARFLAGVADSPETEARGANAVTISTFTVFAGLALDFDGDWTLHLGYSRDDRESSWIRHAFTAGVARAF